MCKRADGISNLTLESVFDSFFMEEMYKKALFKKKTLSVKIMSQ